MLSILLICIGVVLGAYAKKIFSKFKQFKTVLKKDGWILTLRKTYSFIRKKIKKNVFTDKKTLNLTDLLKTTHNMDPLKILHIPSNEARINIVLDTLNKGSFFGGVATALIFATLYANKKSIPLRIISRSSSVNPQDYFSFITLLQLERPQKVEFYNDSERLLGLPQIRRLEVSEKDIFLATSWWSAEALNKMQHKQPLFYILQEYEPYFYPNSDLQVWANNVLEEKNTHFIINSPLLYNFYKNKNYSHLIKQSKMFDPAFPSHMYSAGENSFLAKEKRILMFYARPNHARNLYLSGIKLLDTALLRGLINTNEWEIHFVGEDIEPFEFSNKTKPIFIGQLSWNDYLSYLKQVDLSFSLMLTPHPSYIPLDVASSGGVVLTNTYENKCNISYSKNIICKPLNVENMMAGFKEAIALSKNVDERKNNYQEQTFSHDWQQSFSDSLDYMSELHKI